ncbi:hypothetical protein OROMI_015426 [Orobanche minor]
MSIPEQTFGTAEEDAYMRDLTINILFYNIVTDAVEDWTKRVAEQRRLALYAALFLPLRNTTYNEEKAKKG